MKLYVLLLSSCFIFACSASDTITIQSMNRSIDKTSEDYQLCDEFKLNNAEIKQYFTLAKEVSSTEFHYESLILPCKYHGELNISNNHYKFEIYAGGSGSLYSESDSQSKNYICKNEECCSMFNNLC